MYIHTIFSWREILFAFQAVTFLYFFYLGALFFSVIHHNLIYIILKLYILIAEIPAGNAKVIYLKYIHIICSY